MLHNQPRPQTLPTTNRSLQRAPQPAYRADIDGLRALAVIAVIGYHAFPGAIPGGFVGVDMFFVLSGFLISQIILAGLATQTFQFLTFYERRVRRILPSLLVVLVACLILGWFIDFASEYRRLGKYVAGSAVFASNVFLWHEQGYFESGAETQPLLNLWSLGIEEQFYLAWPLMLWLARARPVGSLVVIVSGLVGSFLLGVLQTQSHPITAFYSPLSRGWELLIGALIAWNVIHAKKRFEPTPRLANALSLVGITFVLIAIFSLTAKVPFPGGWALLPTVGTAALLLAGENAWLNRVVLSRRVLTSVGIISYPWYLWHWPLLVFAPLALGEDILPLATSGAVILVALGLAAATYFLVEKPLRFGPHPRSKAIGLVLALVFIGTTGWWIYLTAPVSSARKEQSDFLDYFENERPAMGYFQRIGRAKSWRDECGFFDFEKYRLGEIANVRNSPPKASLDASCYVRNSKQPKVVLLWGDSHAQQLAPGLRRYLPSSWQFLQIATSGCSLDWKRKTPSEKSQCDQSNYFARETMATIKPDVVIIGQSRALTPARFEEIAAELESLGVRRLVFVGQSPRWTTELPKIVARKLWNGPRRTKLGVFPGYLKRNRDLARQLPVTSSRKFANVVDVFCNSEGCLTYLGGDRKTGLVSWDIAHLTPIASEYLAKQLLVDLIVK